MEVPTLTFTADNLKPQSFPFRKPLFDFISENANANVMSKLFRSCKYFYHRKPYCIVENVSFGRESDAKLEWNTNTTQVHHDQIDQLDNIWVSRQLNFRCCYPTEFLNKFSRCDGELAFSVTCTEDGIFGSGHHRISLRDYKFLIERGTLKKWDSPHVTVTGEDEQLVSLQELLDYLPNVTTLEYETPKNRAVIKLITFSARIQGITREGYKAKQTPRKTKIRKLRLEIANEIPDPEALVEFIKVRLFTFGNDITQIKNYQILAVHCSQSIHSGNV